MEGHCSIGQIPQWVVVPMEEEEEEEDDDDDDFNLIIYLVVGRISTNSDYVKLVQTYCSSILLKTSNKCTERLRQICGIRSGNRTRVLQTKKKLEASKVSF
jgi:hypothetical protein